MKDDLKTNVYPDKRNHFLIFNLLAIY